MMGDGGHAHAELFGKVRHAGLAAIGQDAENPQAHRIGRREKEPRRSAEALTADFITPPNRLGYAHAGCGPPPAMIPAGHTFKRSFERLTGADANAADTLYVI